MAVSTQTILDGPRNAIIKLTNDSGAAESAALKVDVAALDPPAKDVRIDKISMAAQGAVGDVVSLLWDATANVTILNVAAGDSEYVDFCAFGGLQNDAGAGKTGNILLTCPAGATYTITLWLVKHL